MEERARTQESAEESEGKKGVKEVMAEKTRERIRGRERKEIEGRKSIMLDFAKCNHFDPLVADNWYNVSHEKFMQHNVLSFSSSVSF
jgi:hypothetical protein